MYSMLLAQAREPLWPIVIQALSNNGMWVFVGICVLAGTAKHIVGMVLRHRERIALIEAGITPGSQDVEGSFEKTHHHPGKPA